MGFEKNHIIYTAEDIKKYFAGGLTPAEMHAMEKAALDDIFLSEAMEGYHAMTENDWEQQLKLLKYHFQDKQTTKVIAIKRPTSYSIWKVAAAIILVCSGVAITYMLTTRDTASNPSISAVKSKQDSIIRTINEPVYADTEANKIAPLIENIKTKEQTTVTQADKKPVTDIAKLNRQDNVNKKKTVLPSGNESADDLPTTRPDVAGNSDVQSARQTKPEQFETKSKTVISQLSKETEYLNAAEKTNRRTFKAQAIGPDSSPLPFASIRLLNHQPGTDPGTYADVKGNFAIQSADSLLAIEIKSKGYLSQNITLSSDNPSTKILLKPDATALMGESQDEVKVIGYGTKRRKDLTPESEINVAPEDGWDKYEIYINNNLILTDNIMQKKIHGEVVISFEVQGDGSLKNLKVEKPLCDDCDVAALRVIKAGPRWKIIKPGNATGMLKVKF